MALLSVPHGPDLPLPAQHDQVIRARADLGDFNSFQHSHWRLLRLPVLDQPNRPTAVPECSPRPNFPILSQRCCMTVSSAEHHHLVLDVHLARDEALFLLSHLPPQTTLVVATKSPDFTIVIENSRVHPSCHGVNSVGELLN